MRLIQLVHPLHGRRVAVVDEPKLALLATTDMKAASDKDVVQGDASSVYAMARQAIALQRTMAQLVASFRVAERLDYEPIYAGKSDWRILPSFDHPTCPKRVLVAGTGLTHTASAKNRQAMHAAASGEAAPVTDSMKMFEWGLAGGKPAAGQVGVQPEWFYKGSGEILRPHGGTLTVPAYADDGGEEPEIVGCYVIGPDRGVYRVGVTIGNEFSDHVMEKKNYLYLAPSKLRDAAIGPELLTGEVPASVSGTVSVARGGETLWQAPISSGEANMSHSIANLEHHHFKYADHRRPGDAHVFFFGADAFSFGGGVALADGDEMSVAWDGLGRAQRTRLRVDGSADALVTIHAL